MLKRQLNNRYKSYLKKIAIKIQEDLSNKIHDRRIIKIDIPAPEDTNTFGWYIELFRFKGINGRGKVEIWLDLFPNIERPILSICFWSTEIDRIHKVANSFSNDFQDTHPTKVTDYGNGKVLTQPLAKVFQQIFD